MDVKILWIAVAIIVVFFIVKALRSDRKRLEQQVPKPLSEPEVKPEPEQPQKPWTPAEIAVQENLDLIKPLLRGVTKTDIANKGQWSSVITSIDNEDLSDMWQDAQKQPGLWYTYLQTFGLQCDLVSEFTCLPDYMERYSTDDGQPLECNNVYVVESPCWIYTDSENNKSVALKGIVTKKN